MEPRIYTYKVTFEEIPDWYWGAHKEKEYNDGYLGSPDTHAWKWEFYTPILEILEFFPYTDEGWVEALKVEKRCVKPDLSNPLCLNENCGGLMSLEARRRGGTNSAEKLHEEKDDLGRSVHSVKCAAATHAEKDEFGKSVTAVKAGKRGAETLHKEKDDLGRSLHNLKLHEQKDEFGKSVLAMKWHEEKDELGRSVVGVKAAERLNKEKDEFGRSVQGVKNADRLNNEKDDLGRSVNGVKAAERLHKEKDDLGRSSHAVRTLGKVHNEKDDLGRSIHGVKNAAKTNSQKWRDPQHLELGEHAPGVLSQMQQRRGYPHGRENRIRV